MRKETGLLMEQRLRRAVKQLTPPAGQMEQVWEQPVERAFGDEWYLAGTVQPRRGPKGVLWAAAAAACLALVCAVTYYAAFLRLDATVYLDVNPSVELRLNQREEVISAWASNADGETILDGMELKHVNVNTAVNAILGAMLRHGYLGQGQDVVLLSVDSADPERAQALRSRLAADMSNTLEGLTGSGTVLSQTISTDEDLRALASAYGITPGKAALLERLTQAEAGLSYDEIAAMPVGVLLAELERRGISLRDFVDYLETASAAGPRAPSVTPAPSPRPSLPTRAPKPLVSPTPAPSLAPSQDPGAVQNTPGKPGAQVDDDDEDDPDDEDDGPDGDNPDEDDDSDDEDPDGDDDFDDEDDWDDD